MPTETKFHIYGENAATLLIFQALAQSPDGIPLFVKNLKRFGTGQNANWPEMQGAEVWLFPSFGKRYGFGEPDALVVTGGHVFWIEVETTINCQTQLRSLHRALVQLWRFRLFQQALAAGTRTERRSRRISGYTLTDSLDVRTASVRIAGHGVLTPAFRERLAKAGKQGRDHYVLFTVDQPSGEGGEGLGYPQALERERNQLSSGYPEEFDRLPENRCWYAYWKGDLEAKFNVDAVSRLLLDEVYVRIRRT